MQKSLGGGWRLPKNAHHTPAAAMAQISQNTMSSTIALPPREEGTGHHCKRWARFDVGRRLAELLLGFCARRRHACDRANSCAASSIEMPTEPFKLTRLGRDVLTELLKD